VDGHDHGRRALLDCVGARLEGAVRGFYEHRGEVDESRGPLELAFEGGRVLHLTTATDGESVRVIDGLWTDPLSDPDEEVDEAWVREHGRWLRLDVSARPGWAEAVGERLAGIRWLANGHGSVAGAEMRFGPAAMTFVSWGDDEWVFAGGADAVPAEWGMRMVPSPETQMEAR
jgi:hypothetical protein